MIIVGIDNAGANRLNEYGPWKTTTGSTPETRNAGGLGEEYAKWVVETVKPFIDIHYRTKPQQEHTLLAGSSMGGIITAYMGSRYPHIFGHLGCFRLPLGLVSRIFCVLRTNIRYNPIPKCLFRLALTKAMKSIRTLSLIRTKPILIVRSITTKH